MINNTDYFEDILRRPIAKHADTFALLNTLHDIETGYVQTYEASSNTILPGHPAFDDLGPPSMDAVISIQSNNKRDLNSKS